MTSHLSIPASDPIPVRIVSEANAADEPDTSLLEIALSAHQDAYRELTQGWRSVETKAQGTIGLAGIFMAAAFAFARDLPADGNGLTVMLFAAAVVLLACSAAAAVWAQRVRTIPVAPSLLVHQWVEDIRGNPADQQAGRLPGFYEDYNDAWLKTNQGLVDLVRSKAKSVMVAQVALLLASACVTTATIVTLMSHQPPAAQEEVHAQVHPVR